MSATLVYWYKEKGALHSLKCRSMCRYENHKAKYGVNIPIPSSQVGRIVLFATEKEICTCSKYECYKQPNAENMLLPKLCMYNLSLQISIVCRFFLKI